MTIFLFLRDNKYQQDYDTVKAAYVVVCWAFTGKETNDIGQLEQNMKSRYPTLLELPEQNTTDWWLKRQTFLTVLEVQDQGASRFSSSSWFVDSCLLLYPLVVEKGSSDVSSSSYKGTNTIIIT